MSKTKICCEEQIIKEIRQRKIHGLKKYGKTVDQNPLSLLEWIEHAKQEAMDFIIYLERTKRQIELEKTNERRIKRLNNSVGKRR